MKKLQTEILIVGGGLSGLLAAYSLSDIAEKIIIVDQQKFTNNSVFSSDLRTTAIAEGTREFFEDIALWKAIKSFCEPIKTIVVNDRKKTNFINFENKNISNNLGYVIENRILKKNLIKLLRLKKNVKFVESESLKNLEISNTYIEATLSNYKVKATLIIAADGKNSFTRKILKTHIFKKKYAHKAMVLNLTHSKKHNNVAHELFLKTGPLAILPMKSESKKFYKSSVIWSSTPELINSLQKIDISVVKEIIEEKISDYIGEVISIDNFKNFPLSAHINSTFYENRLVYVGDSAHSIHPIAGQGWNLGVRDIKNLKNCINQSKMQGLDLGSKLVCKKYHDSSFYDSYALYQITDKLNYIFLQEDFVNLNIRKIGFGFIEKSKKVKNIITNFAMGL